MTESMERAGVSRRGFLGGVGITAGFDTEVGLTHDTTTSRAGSAPKVR